jgi:hypothetical protein
MSVTQVLRGLGNWGVSLRDDMPAEVWDGIDYFGHVVVHTGRTDPRIAGDSLLRSSRYTGVLRSKSESGLPKSIGGLDIAMWLGDPDNKSDIIETPLAVNDDFEGVITAIMSGFDAVQIGTIFNIAGLFSQTFQYQSRREAVDYVCQTIGGMAWRVNGDATLDAGTEADLFVVNPEVIVMRKPKNMPGLTGSEVDMFLRALNGSMQTDQDVEDLSTRVILLAQGINGQFASATADAPPGTHPYLDLHGNPIKLTRIEQESATDPGNADARAQLQLNRFLGTRDAITLSTEFYDISGVARPGDYLWVWDPSMKLEDPSNEKFFQGKWMNPVKLQLTETTWPIVQGMSVLYRHWDGTWTDLTDYIVWESGETSIVVGGYNRALSSGGSGTFPITQPDENTTVPNAPTWNEPFVGSVYQSPSTGETKAEVILSWNRPTNTDTTLITDGDHYEIRYRQSTTPFFPVVWDQIEPPTGLYEVWDQWEATGATWDYPVVFPGSDWQTAVAPFDTETFRLSELTPSLPYEAQIRAIDTGVPPNVSVWSDLALFQTINDNLPPATPAPPFIAANPLSVQMTHTLGRSDGGEYNLDRDIHHLELHGGTEPLFTPTESTLLGKVLANYGMIIGNIPVVETFQIASVLPVYFKVIAVDEAGNKSQPSTAVVMSIGLLTDQYISNLTASKITAGTINASILVGGRIATMTTGDFPGVELTATGIKGWNTSGFNSLRWDSSTGRLHVDGNGGIEIQDGNLTVLNAAGTKIVEVGECADGRHGVQVYTDAGVRVARMGELASGSEGIEVISDTGELVRVDTLAFGTRAASISAQESTSANAYVNLATVGPYTTVPVGNSGRCVVILSARINGPGTSLTNASVGFDMAGPSSYFRTANVFESQWIAFSDSAGNLGVNISLSKVVLVSGLPSAGNYTVQMKYWTNGTSHSFADRHIVAIPF